MNDLIGTWVAAAVVGLGYKANQICRTFCKASHVARVASRLSQIRATCVRGKSGRSQHPNAIADPNKVVSRNRELQSFIDASVLSFLLLPPLNMTARAHELSTSILDNISSIQKFLEVNKLPNLSIEQDVPLQFQANPDFAEPRDAAVLACKELLCLLTGAFGTFTSQTACLPWDLPHRLANNVVASRICQYASHLPLQNRRELP